MYKTKEKIIPLTGIQKLIGKRMLASKAAKPCFYLEAKADITELMGMRHKLKKKLGVKITTNSFYLRSMAKAVVKYPLIIGRLGADCVNIPESINIGFAVNASQGLVVPVIKQADGKTLAMLAQEEKALTEKARSNKLTLEELEGETIAMSNLGAYGIDSFLGIVPPPASSILAVGNAIRTLVPRDGGVFVKKIVSLTVAIDHRIINGNYAAEFLGFIKQQLENPQQLL